MTIIKLATAKEPYVVKESYGTIKSRIANTSAFIEVSFTDRKVTINKGIVEEFASDKPNVLVNPKKKGGKK